VESHRICINGNVYEITLKEPGIQHPPPVYVFKEISVTDLPTEDLSLFFDARVQAVSDRELLKQNWHIWVMEDD